MTGKTWIFKIYDMKHVICNILLKKERDFSLSGADSEEQEKRGDALDCGNAKSIEL